MAAVLAEVLQHDPDHRLVGHAVILEVDGVVGPGKADGPHRHTGTRGLIDEAQRPGDRHQVVVVRDED